MKGNGRNVVWLRAHVNFDGPSCLIWPFGKESCGYGQFGCNGRMYRAHRWMCEQTHGAPPSKGHYAAHSCGNGHLGCVHPQHLSWKTPTENACDAIRHGTTRRGRRESLRKLSHAQVLEILELRGKKTLKQLGEMYGVKARQISRIFSGHSWRGGLPRTTGRGTVNHKLIEEMPS